MMSQTDNDVPDEMRINPQRAKELLENLSHVMQQIQNANKTNKKVRLIAVSKLKPPSDILALHQPQAPAHEAQLHFGENYYQELLHKSSILPDTIRWHFIGALQTNKCKPLADNVRGLWCVSSVDSVKKADGLEKGRRAVAERRAQERKGELKRAEAGTAGMERQGKEQEDEPTADGGGRSDEGRDLERLRVHVQVNTSGEESKSGVEPDNTAELCKHIMDSCPHLHLTGLMTIGAIARSTATTPETENEDFTCLREVRDRVAQDLRMRKEDLELSMGMSADFEAAITQGSDEVRVGTGIFGERPKKGDAQAKGDVEEEKG